MTTLLIKRLRFGCLVALGALAQAQSLTIHNTSSRIWWLSPRTANVDLFLELTEEPSGPTISVKLDRTPASPLGLAPGSIVTFSLGAHTAFTSLEHFELLDSYRTNPKHFALFPRNTLDAAGLPATHPIYSFAAFTQLSAEECARLGDGISLSGMILTIRADSYQALFPAPRPQPSPAPSPAPSTATLDERIKAAQAEVAALTAALARGDQALSEAGLPSPRPNTGTLALPYAYPYPLATASPSLGAPYALPTFPRGDLSPASLLGSLNLLAPSSTWAAYLGSASAMPSVLARPLVPRSALPPPYPTPVAAAAHAASLSSLRPAFSLALLGPWPSRSRSTQPSAPTIRNGALPPFSPGHLSPSSALDRLDLSPSPLGTGTQGSTSLAPGTPLGTAVSPTSTPKRARAEAPSTAEASASRVEPPQVTRKAQKFKARQTPSLARPSSTSPELILPGPGHRSASAPASQAEPQPVAPLLPALACPAVPTPDAEGEALPAQAEANGNPDLIIYNLTEQSRTLAIKKLTAPLRIKHNGSGDWLAATLLLPGEDFHYAVPANTRVSLSPEDGALPGAMDFSVEDPNTLSQGTGRSIHWAFAQDGLSRSLLQETTDPARIPMPLLSTIDLDHSATILTILDNPFAGDQATRDAYGDWF